MKRRAIATYSKDFDSWLGYEFWSRQAETQIDQERSSLEQDAPLEEKYVMESQNQYQVRPITQAEQGRENDALPF